MTTYPLAELCDVFTDGDWIETKDQSNQGIRLVQTGNVGLGFFKNKVEKARYISEETFERLRCIEIYQGDCLVSRLPDPVGRSCIIPSTGQRMITAVDCSIIRFDKDRIDPRYFNYYARSSQYLSNVASASTGTTRTRISRSILGKIPVPVPPLREQERLIGILDKAFENIAIAGTNTKEHIRSARELFDSVLSAVFSGNGKGWHTVPLDKFVHFIDYRGKTPAKSTTGMRLITAKNVRMGFIRSSPAEFVDPASYDTWMTRGIPRFGDVLFTTEAPLANVAQLNTNERVVFAQRIIIMQAEPSKLDSTFLKYALMSGPLQKRIHEQGTGATAKGIKASLLKKIAISFPTAVREQRAFVARFDGLQQCIDHLVKQLETKLAAIEELKRSVLHAAFIGDL